MNARERRGPAPLGLGRAIEPVYRAVVSRRNRNFDSGKRVTRFGVPVISVGNLSVGGTGKSPMVKQIVQWLLDDGRHPAIAMRGYRARPGELSDEQREYALTLKGVPLVAQPDRAAGLAPLVSSGQVDRVVLDDGFQHRFIARDLDIVLLDTSRDVFADRCLPAGWLREPVSSLSRADVIVFTHCEASTEQSLSAQRTKLHAVAPEALIVEAEHAWSSLNGPDGPEPVEKLQDQLVIVACGIGHPSAFVSLAEAHGARVVNSVVHRDHHEWSKAEAQRLLQLAKDTSCPDIPPLILTTEKDWSSLERVMPEGVTILRPALELRFRLGQDALRSAVLGCKAGKVVS